MKPFTTIQHQPSTPNFQGQKGIASMSCLLMSLFIISACSSGSGISDIQIGETGGQEAFVGQDLAISGNISSHADLVDVTIEITPESGEGWTFEQQYTDGIAGAKQAKFEQKIPVPLTAETGNYVLVIRAIDTHGHLIEETKPFRIGIDSTVPTASDLDIGINAAGNDLHLETELTVPTKLAKVVVAIKGDDWSDEVTFDGEAIVGKLTHHFHEHIKVGEAPEGTYEVVLTAEDQKGRQCHVTGTFTK